jgi:hypothetical protein
MTTLGGVIDRAGAWTGTNGFRLMPSDPMHDAPATAEVSVKAGGTLVAVAYTWAHPDDGAQDGLLVMGAAGEKRGVTALWGDSWHQSPEPRICTGAVDDEVIALTMEYEAGWRWVITLDPTDADVLRLQMDNVIPEGAGAASPAGAYPVMVMVLQRAGS